MHQLKLFMRIILVYNYRYPSPAQPFYEDRRRKGMLLFLIFNYYESRIHAKSTMASIQSNTNRHQYYPISALSDICLFLSFADKNKNSMCFLFMY